MPLKKVPEGWYLVYWRAISVDGHPVRGAFTFAVGPEPGPGAAVPGPVDLGDGGDARASSPPAGSCSSRVDGGDRAVRASGSSIARPLVRRRAGTRACARVSIAFAVAAAVGLLAIPVYLAARDGGVRAPLGVRRRRRSCRSSATRRSGAATSTSSSASRCSSLAAAVALWVDRPEREHRSIAELLADRRRARRGGGRARSCPGAAGHAAQTAPRGALARARLAPPGRGLDLARRPDRAARALAASLPAGAPRGRARGRRAALLERRASSRCCVLLGSGIWATVDPPADARRRSGRPPTGR